jgi:hypothetical protein
MNRPNAWLLNAQKSKVTVLYAVGITTFCVARLYYWHITYEVPFSDMIDYVRLGQRVASSFNFRWDSFWLAYKPPTFPLLLAINFRLFGADNLSAWRCFQTILLLFSLLWLCREIAIATKNQYFGLALFWIVALSKSSIFWSYKPAMESATEAFIYLIAATSIFALRRQRAILFALVGFVCAAAVMLRPQFILVTALLFGALLLQSVLDSAGWRKIAIFLLCFVLGGLIACAPWEIRNYRVYGHAVLLSTQGSYAFLWETGAVTITDADGTRITRDVFQLLAEAPERFRNDDEAVKFANRFVLEWLSEQGAQFPRILVHRAISTIITPTSDAPSGLTRVSRTHLMPPRYNRFLIDKSPLLQITGIAGLAAFTWLALGTLYPVAIVPIGQWMLGVVFSSYPRYAEPSVPLFLFGNVIWVILVWRLVGRNFVTFGALSGERRKD